MWGTPLLSALALCMLWLNAVTGQEQGRPTGYPSSREYADYFFSTGDQKVVVVAASVCPADSEWHRNLLSLLLLPERRTPGLIAQGAISFRGLLQRCEWPAVSLWFRQVLMETTDYSQAFSLIRSIEETWMPSDRDLLFEYARAGVEASTRTLALQTISRHLTPEQRVDLLVAAFEAGTLTEPYFRIEQGLLAAGGTGDLFAARGAQALLANPDRPMAASLLEAVAQAAATTPGVSPGTATTVLRALNEMAGRPDVEDANRWRAAVARKAGGL